MPIKYLHTMVRVKDLDASIAFYKLLGWWNAAVQKTKAAALRWCFCALRGWTTGTPMLN